MSSPDDAQCSNTGNKPHPQSQSNMQRSVSSLSLDSIASGASLPRLSIPVTDCLSQASKGISTVSSDPHQQTKITAKLANELETNKIFNKVSKQAKQFIQDALDEIETTYTNKILSLISNLSINPLEREDTLQPLYDKFKVIEDKISDLQTQLPQSKSYASALKNSSKLPTTLKIFPQPGTSEENILDEIKALDCPKGVNLTKLKKTKGAVELRTNSVAAKDILKPFLEEKLKTAVVKDKRPALTRVIFHNASAHSEEEVLQSLSAYGLQKEDITQVATLNSKRDQHQHWVFDITKAKAEAHLLQNYSDDKPSYILIGFKKLYFKIFRRLIRCLNCHVLGAHNHQQCDASPFCVICGEKGHNDFNCTKQTSCINCSHFNDSIAEKSKGKIAPFDENHPASDSACPSYRLCLQRLIRGQFLPFTDTAKFIRTYPTAPPKESRRQLLPVVCDPSVASNTSN